VSENPKSGVMFLLLTQQELVPFEVSVDLGV
jgi:hypothetical protein